MSTRGEFLKRAAAGALAFPAFGIGNNTRSAREEARTLRGSGRYNVLWLLTDDQPPFGSVEKMPFVRRFFAEDGLTFSRAYQMGKCAPSRASAPTGLYPHSHGIRDNEGAARRYVNSRLTDRAIFPKLKAAGYATALCGKWTNGYEDIPAWRHRGVDNWTVVLANRDPVEVNQDGEIVRDVCPIEQETDYLRDRIDAFIRNNRRRPWVAYATLKAPHSPYAPSPRNANAFSDEELMRRPNYDEADVSDKPEARRDRPREDDALRESRLAVQLGKRRELLDVDDAARALWSTIVATGQADRTFVIYCTDNGWMNGEHRLDGKGQPYEESVKNPLYVRGPGVASGTTAALSQLVDVPATIADLAGLEAFGEGRSLVPLFGGTTPRAWRRRVLIKHPDDNWRGVRDVSLGADWKYVESETEEIELYDMGSDPYELESLHEDPRTTDVRAYLAAKTAELSRAEGQKAFASAEA